MVVFDIFEQTCFGYFLDGEYTVKNEVLSIGGTFFIESAGTYLVVYDIFEKTSFGPFLDAEYTVKKRGFEHWRSFLYTLQEHVR